MHEEHHELSEQDLNLLEEMGYEHSDIDPAAKHSGRWSAWGILIFFNFFVVVSLATIYFVAPDLVGVPSAEKLERRRMPEAPAPLLQSNTTAHTDTWTLREEEAKKLGRYGWATKDQRAAIVPVEEAMRSVGEQGIPRWTQNYDENPAVGTAPVATSSESNPNPRIRQTITAGER
ncbi:MAG: hypothetical protein KF812_02855 [Fimbriimonadaceae bacterium]|nr:hypothetical protein [Fimbriimonadaceae bacterium]